jgi:hypothetical protein
MALSYAPQPQRSNKPTGALGQTHDRTASTSTQALTSGRLYVVGYDFRAGDVVTSITFYSTATAISGGTHGWAAVFTSGIVPLGQSTDDTSVAWAASTAKTFTMSAPVVIPSDGFGYLGLMIAATTPPSVECTVPGSASQLAAPAVGGQSTLSGLTGTAPNPGAAITGGVVIRATFA